MSTHIIKPSLSNFNNVYSPQQQSYPFYINFKFYNESFLRFFNIFGQKVQTIIFKQYIIKHFCININNEIDLLIQNQQTHKIYENHEYIRAYTLVIVKRQELKRVNKLFQQQNKEKVEKKIKKEKDEKKIIELDTKDKRFFMILNNKISNQYNNDIDVKNINLICKISQAINKNQSVYFFVRKFQTSDIYAFAKIDRLIQNKQKYTLKIQVFNIGSLPALKYQSIFNKKIFNLMKFTKNGDQIDEQTALNIILLLNQNNSLDKCISNENEIVNNRKNEEWECLQMNDGLKQNKKEQENQSDSTRNSCEQEQRKRQRSRSREKIKKVLNVKKHKKVLV